MDDTDLFVNIQTRPFSKVENGRYTPVFTPPTHTSVVSIFEVQIGPVFQRKTGPEWTMKLPPVDVQIALVF